MIYKALKAIQIFLAGDGRTDEGVLRGPRGPKNKDMKLASND